MADGATIADRAKEPFGGLPLQWARRPTAAQPEIDDHTHAHPLYPLLRLVFRAATCDGRPLLLLRELFGRFGLRAPGHPPPGECPAVRFDVRPFPPSGPPRKPVRGRSAARAMTSPSSSAPRRTTGEQLPSYRVIAHNAATESENKIHDDDVAQQYGFAGGL